MYEEVLLPELNSKNPERWYNYSLGDVLSGNAWKC